MKSTLSLLVLTLSILTATAAPLGTAFTYQGRLANGTTPANGIYDFTFALVDDSGLRLWRAPQRSGRRGNQWLLHRPLASGNVFDGAALYLDHHRQNERCGHLHYPHPRQPLTATPTPSCPRASLRSAASAALQFTNAANTFAGNGSALTSLNPANLGPGLIPDANVAPNIPRTNQVWLTGGNRGTTSGNDLGAADNQPLQFKSTTLAPFALNP